MPGFTTQQLEQVAGPLGYQIDTSGRHLKIRRGDERFVVVSRSPSDHRAAKNLVSSLRRHGYGDLADALAPRPPKPQPPRPEADMPRRPPAKSTPVPETNGASMTATVETITADHARQFLAANEGNRHIRPDYVRQLTDQFLAGDMMGGVGTVVVADTGRLLDGQHRLTALLSADRAEPGLTWNNVVVVRGVPEAAVVVMDNPKPRRLPDVLKLERKEPNNLLLAGALTTLHRILRRRYVIGGAWTRWMPSNHEALRLLDQCPTIRDSVRAVHARQTAARLLSPAIATSLHWMMEQVETGAGDEFMGALHTGRFGDVPQVHELREHCMAVKAKPYDNRIHPVDALKWASITWNATRTGQSLHKMKLVRAQVVPDLDGFTGYVSTAGRLRQLVDSSPPPPPA